MTFNDFDNKTLSKQHDIIQWFISKSRANSIKNQFIKIDDVLTFLLEIDELTSPKSFLLSFVNPHFIIFSSEGRNKSKLLNA